MRDIACRTAQLWLLEPRDLDVADAEFLDSHLRRCPSCKDLQMRQLDLDRRIQEYVSLSSAAGSVRSNVRRALLQAQPAPAEKKRRSNWLRWRMAWITAPLLLITAAAALLVPGYPLNGGGGDRLPAVTVAAGWKVPRLGVGYPIAVDPTRPDHLLVGAWGRVYESWNAGNSWRPLAPLPPNLVLRAVDFDSTQPGRYLVATKYSVFVSPDRGKHWTRTADSLPGAMNMFLMQDPHQAGTFYLGPSILWKSVDHGQTWGWAGTGTVFAPYGIQTLAVAPSGQLWTGIWGGGVAVSADGGRTWQRRRRGLAKNVLNVALAPNGAVWAATDRGLYGSDDAGFHWRHIALPGHFYATSVLAQLGYLLAGGHGVLYRSDDGGKHWYLSMSGLPLDPYVYNLVADPFHPDRVYASLDADGVFRSDDGGKHWTSIDGAWTAGGSKMSISLLFFRRFGALWHTDTRGTDPGVLTVDRDVRLAALAPDGAAIAYLAADSDGWAVRVVNAVGGSAARTLAAGSGPPPQALLWSPNASLLAIVSARTVTVTDLGHTTRRWSLISPSSPSTRRRTVTQRVRATSTRHSAKRPAEQVLGWTADGRSLLVWNGGTGRVSTVPWTGGARQSELPGLYPVAPLAAPDGRHMAFVWKGYLHTGVWGAGIQNTVPARTARRAGVPCRLQAWSDQSARLLAVCGHRVQARNAKGRLLADFELPPSSWFSWAPGSDRTLLLSRRGGLWVWPFSSRRPHRIVANAAPVLPE